MNTTIENKEILMINNYIEKANKRNMIITIKKPLTKSIFAVIKHYIKHNDVCVYGGTAINNILPKGSQFYDEKIDMPDYDFFVPDYTEI